MSDQQIEQKRLLIVKILKQNIKNQCEVKCILLNNQLSCLLEIIANKNNERLNGSVDLIEVLDAISVLAEKDLFHVVLFAQSFDYKADIIPDLVTKVTKDAYIRSMNSGTGAVIRRGNQIVRVNKNGTVSVIKNLPPLLAVKKRSRYKVKDQS